MVSHCMCGLLVQIIHSYLTAPKSFISTLYNNSFHMTGGSAINKIKRKRKDLIKIKKKKDDIKSGIKSGKKPSCHFFLEQEAALSGEQLAKPLMKALLASHLCANAAETEPKVAKPGFAVQRRGKTMPKDKRKRRVSRRGHGSRPPALIHPTFPPWEIIKVF